MKQEAVPLHVVLRCEYNQQSASCQSARLTLRLSLQCHHHIGETFPMALSRVDVMVS